MISKVIAFLTNEGELQIVYPVINFNEVGEYTEQMAIERALNKCVPLYASPVLLDKASLPDERIFREAWDLSSGKIKVNMTKARVVFKNKINQVGVPRLEELDVEYIRADEQGRSDLKAGIVAEKQRIRDATKNPMIQSAKT